MWKSHINILDIFPNNRELFEESQLIYGEYFKGITS